MKTRFTHLATVLLCGVLAAAHAAVPVVWTNTPAATQPYPLKPVPHGVPVDFRVTLRGYTDPPAVPGADVRLWFQTNGMGSAWWSAPATLEGDVITATFGAEQDTGADRVALFFGAPSNVFASAILRLTHSPGFTPNVRPPPVARLDFSALEVLNAPYYTQAETDARIVALAPTPGDYANVSNRAMSALQPSALSSANPAFAAAVTNCPVVIAADADIAEYGTYGTVAAALAALAAGLAALKRGKVDKVTGSGITGYLPVLKSDGGLQRSYYTPQSFASSGHSHDATSVWYDGYDVAWKLGDLEARVAALEEGDVIGDAEITIGTPYYDSMTMMSPVAYPGVVGCKDGMSSMGVDPYKCMTCLMVRADFLLDPDSCVEGDYSMGGTVKPEYANNGLYLCARGDTCGATATFRAAVDYGVTCYCAVSVLDGYNFSYLRNAQPGGGVTGALVQDEGGAWWICVPPRLPMYGESPDSMQEYNIDSGDGLALYLAEEYNMGCNPCGSPAEVRITIEDTCGLTVYEGTVQVEIYEEPPVTI
ncbi:MAG: hypothetical protein IJ146_12335 [Kiritimatiellae bacterium]|nr:hypothetical protein [Kiritimatiellia bacterium]